MLDNALFVPPIPGLLDVFALVGRAGRLLGSYGGGSRFR